MRTSLPVDRKVVVTRRTMTKDCGTTTWSGRSYRICINSGLSGQSQVDTLVHEWAHVLAIEAAYGHGTAFGVAYAQAYCALLDNYQDLEDFCNEG